MLIFVVFIARISRRGSVNNEVTIELAPGVVLTSVVTKASCERLGLKVGDSAYALIKASSVMIGVDD